jgi:glycosyltransferase involved in cell wall biosynthesis
VPREPSIEVVLTAHNEEGTIGSTIREFVGAADRHALDVDILVAEDGSSDRTRDVVAGSAERQDGRVRLTPPSQQKGYSRAVADAYRLTRRDVVVCCDGDGQYDPDDLPRLLGALSPGVVVAGARSPRRDSRSRLLASWAFGRVYRLLTGVRMQDPSSSFVAAFRRDVLSVLPATPVLPQGFWWEFFARADAAGLRILEVPVSHRRRDGTTRIYRLRRLPQIVLVHLAGLVRLRNELRRLPVEDTRPASPAVVKTR